MNLNRSCIYYRCLLLGSSSLFLELLSFFYRILLGRIAGPKVMALHGLVMSAYSVLLSCTLTGISLAVPRLVAADLAANRTCRIRPTIQAALSLFLGAFLIMSIPFLWGNRFIARHILGDCSTKKALLLILPCLFLTGFENIHKAYFYGAGKAMVPSFSETLEMFCRIVGTAILFIIFPGQGASGAALILWAMIFSELFSAVFMVGMFRREKWKEGVWNRNIRRDILENAVPISLSTLLVRLISAADLVLLPRIMAVGKGDSSFVMAEFGLLTGMILPMIWLPAAFLSPLTVVLSPRISAAKELGQDSFIRRRAGKAIHVAGLVGFPAVMVMVVWGEKIGNLLYGEAFTVENFPKNTLLLLSLGTLAGMYHGICESLLESLGCQKFCSTLVVLMSFLQLGTTIFLGGIFRWGLEGYLWGQLFSQTAGAGAAMLCLKKECGLCFRLRNWTVIPLVCSLAAVAFQKWVSQKMPLFSYNAVFELTVFFLLYIILLKYLGTDFGAYTWGTLFHQEQGKNRELG